MKLASVRHRGLACTPGWRQAWRWVLAVSTMALLGRVASADAPPARSPAAVPGVVAAPPVASMGTRLAFSRDRRPRRPRLLWTGFTAQRERRIAEVWVQTSAAVAAELVPSAASGDVARIRLKGCATPRRRTDRLPLDTRFFGTTISRVALATRGRDLEVQVSLLRPQRPPTTRQQAGPEGSAFWIFTFAVEGGDGPVPTPSAGARASAAQGAGHS